MPLLVALVKVALLIVACLPLAWISEKLFSRWAMVASHRQAVREMVHKYGAEAAFWRWLEDEYPEDAAQYETVRRSVMR